MDMDELMQRIDKARLHALKEAKDLTKEADGLEARDEVERGLAHRIGADSQLSVARALDTILGLNTPVPLLDNSPGPLQPGL